MPEFFDSRAAFPMKTKQSLYARGGRVGAKEGKWIQAAFAKSKKKGTLGRCTGKKFGSETCPPGSKQYAMAKTLRKINRG
jgi:hypothetical protein